MKDFISKFKKFIITIISLLFVLTLSSCSSLNANIKKDGSGSATLIIEKSDSYTLSEIKEKAEQLEKSAEVVSGQEHRLTVKNVKEYSDHFEINLKFMRIQYLSKNGVGGNLGIYNLTDYSDFLGELDSVSLLYDYWYTGSYKNYTKLSDGYEDDKIYKFDNAKFGDNKAKITPTYLDGQELSDDEINEFFIEESSFPTNKKGKIFTFNLVDIEGLSEITFKFNGKIKIYGANNISSITNNSITIKPIKQSANIIYSKDQSIETKEVDCFVGYVYYLESPNYLLISLLSILGISLILFIILGFRKNLFKKIIHSKKFKLIISNYDLYLMLLPAFIMLFIFSYIPMSGIIIAFKNYRVSDGIFGSEWAPLWGFDNFKSIFTNPVANFPKLMANTFILAFYKFIFGFVLAIGLAVLFNYLKNGIFKKTVQTISYFPYFISWVVISTLSYVLLATDGGTFNKIGELFGNEQINFYASPQYWRLILTSSAMWKTAGYSTIVYLAAMAGIDKSIYEAARIDGANGFKQFIHVTIPGLLPAFGIQVVFSLGNLVKDDFDQIYTMIRGSALLRDTTDTIGMIVYENISNPSNYATVAAMSMIQSLIALILVVISNKVLIKLTGEGAY